MTDATKRVAVVDFETRSELDVRKVGAWRYAEHPSTEILCLSYKIKPGGVTKTWVPGIPFPQELLDAIEDDDVFFEAHNAQFERAIWHHLLRTGRYGGPAVAMPRRWKDTLAACAYRGVPLALDAVGDVVDLPTKKDKRGKYLLQKLSKPRRPLKKERQAFEEQGLAEEDWPTLWVEDWGLVEELYDYCERDVDTEDALGETIGDLPPAEQRIWVLDQIINQRGVAVDLEAVHACNKLVGLIKAQLNAELADITNGEVTAGTEVAKLTAWLNDHGLGMAGLKKEDVKHAMRRLGAAVETGRAHPEEIKHVYRALEIRQQVSRSSTSKLEKFLTCVCDDGRMRGLLQYHGAGTGRWAGRLAQPQNFPRGSLEDYADMLGLSDGETMDFLIEVIKTAAELEDPSYVDMIFGDPMEALTTALRGLFVAGEGKVLRVADFSAIEAVALAWLANEEWKLEAFRKAQAGTGPEIYCVAAEAVFGYPVLGKKTHPKERSIGKVLELACGYQGWIGAWRNFDSREPDEDGYLEDHEIAEYMGAWREKHPATRSLWYDLDAMAVRTVETGRAHGWPQLYYEIVEDAAGKWLACVLPSGRRIWYYNPIVVNQPRPNGGTKKTVRFEGKDNKKGGAWGPIYGYGGLWTENVIQAICRDLMVEAMIRVEKAGYPIILTVHDEIMAETPKDFGAQEEFEDLMAQIPPWMAGCPVAVDGWWGTRYRK